jgi:hypothetical protein
VSESLTSIENTGEKFEPRWPVELSKAGEISDNHRFLIPTGLSKEVINGLQVLAFSIYISVPNVEKNFAEVAWTQHCLTKTKMGSIVLAALVFI